MFGMNVVISQAKAELLKPDMNHNKVPDAIEVLEAGEQGCETLAEFASHIDQNDVRELIDVLPPRLRAKLSEDLISKMVADIPKIPPALHTAAVVMQGTEEWLKSK